MAISAGSGGADLPMSDINTTPLVDVMLVLLIIFLITIPVVVQSVKVELPKIEYLATTTKPENVLLTVRGGQNDAPCEVYWGQTPVSSDELFTRAEERMKREKEKKNLNVPGAVIKPDDIPEAHIRADVGTAWRCVAGAIFQMQQAGYPRVGFISEPPARATGG